MTKRVYLFGDGNAEGRAGMEDLLGGKGANLAEMSSLGLPVPPGFTITTEVCAAWNRGGYPDDLAGQVDEALARVERATGAAFGAADDPLLVSVRSGAPVSMPGMLDTVLNLGLNDETVPGLAAKSGDSRFAWDSYRRFVQMYGSVVLGVDHGRFEEMIDARKADAAHDSDLGAEDWRELAEVFKELIEAETGQAFPQNPRDQLWGAIDAVFGSWRNERAETYRALHGIPDSPGTAVTVQAMAFGNMGDDCATGVAFTRDPSTGENVFYGEYLLNAQGEDVVAGIRTPLPLAAGGEGPSLEEVMPEAFERLRAARDSLERHFRDMQDIEFTVQRGRLWMLQTRSGKRTARAALKIACDMAAEGLVSKAEAVSRLEPESLDQLLHPVLDPDAERRVLVRGLPASPGAASGRAAFTAGEAEAAAANGEKVILVRIETSPDDIHGMHAAQGILTSRGGMTSHAAVVARGMGRPCVVGAGDLRIDYQARSLAAHGHSVFAGEKITIDGASGEVMIGESPTLQPELSGDFATVMGWADEIRRLGVRANAETPEDARAAVGFGAEGIGLCRTEHMFFDAERLVAVREMILAADGDGRRAALGKLLPMQRRDFAELFRIMEGRPVTIRLLDPPLHEFLPRTDEEMREVAEAAGIEIEALRRRADDLAEVNPMLGLRGCRLGISYPEITEMQVRAIFEAAAEILPETPVAPEIMVPLVSDRREFDLLRERIDAVAAEACRERGVEVPYLVGTMIELPRAALRAGEIAAGAEFFSFGTNDLTQTTFGLSRDDTAGLLKDYARRGLLEADPFATLDTDGVGELVRIGVERGRAARVGLKLGICGEHGGDPASIRFCAEVGLDYVSCSPYRVPIARLAAAQAALKAEA